VVLPQPFSPIKPQRAPRGMPPGLNCRNGWRQEKPGILIIHRHRTPSNGVSLDGLAASHGLLPLHGCSAKAEATEQQ